MTTAAIYVRISDDKSGEALGVANQLAACKDFIKRKQWTLGKIYTDNDVSATTGAVRAQFEHMLLDAPDVVVSFKQDRLTRSSLDTLRIKAAGITGYLTDGGMLDFSSADAGMLTMIRSAIDEAEGKKKAERQKLRNRADFKAGKWGTYKPVFGNNIKTGKKVEAEAEAVLKAAKSIADEKATFYGIAKAWNDAGLRTARAASGYGGMLWSGQTVRAFFTSPRLAGFRIYDGEENIMAGWEPILTRELWDQVQLQLSKNATGKGAPGKQVERAQTRVLSGIATCGECGTGLVSGTSGGKAKGITRTYKCRNPGHVSRNAEKLERFVVEKFLYLLIHSGAEEVINPDGHTSTAPLRAQRTKLVMDYDTWMDEATKENLPPSIIGKRVRAHTEQLAAIDAQLLEATKDAIFSDLLPSLVEVGPDALWDRWETVPVPQKREIIKALYTEISVNKAPRGVRFDPSAVTLRATPLMMELVELNL